MIYFKTFMVFAGLICFSSCGNKENNKMIIGNWSGQEWLVNGSPSNRNVRETHFTFDDKGNYSYTYSGTKENGTYKVENDMLFTKPGDQQEIMVKIKKLSDDTLIFDMNRSGQTELLTLVRK